MTRTELKKEVAKALDTREIGDDFDFRKCEEFDSLGVMALVAMISANFGKTVSGQKLAALTTLDSLIELIGQSRIENE